MPHSRSITALTREHIGLRVRIVDGTSVRSGQLTNIEAAQTYSPNSHPNEWLIEIDGVPQAHSVSATWSKVTNRHDLVAASDAADEMSKRSIKPGPSRIGTLLKKLFGSR